MASKVNVKFVVILSVALLILAAGVGVLGAMVLFNSADDNIKRGDELAAQGEYIEAAKAYGKAVNKESYNAEYLRKWLGATQKAIPETDVEYRAMYFREYMGGLRQLAVVERTNPATQEDMILATFRQLKLSGANADNWGTFNDAVTTALEGLDMSQIEAQRLLRYRGLGSVYRFRTLDSVDQSERARAKDDLEKALLADPGDIEVALAVVETQSSQAMALFRGGRQQESSARWNEAMAAINQLNQQFPDSPRVILRRALMTAERAIQESATPAEQAAITEELRADVFSAIAAARTVPPAEIDEQFLGQLSRATSIARGADISERWLDLLNELSAKEPSNSAFLLERGKALVMLERHDEAIAQFDQITTMPDLPISLDGLILRQLRIEARRLQVESALALWAQASGADKDPALARVKRYRDALAETVAEDSPALLRSNAQIAFSERRLDDAVDALTKLRNVTNGDDTEVLTMLGRALEAQDKIGAAAEQFRRVYERDPANFVALISLINLELRSGNRQVARELLAEAEKLAPDNPVVAAIKQQIDVANSGTPAADDPALVFLNSSLRYRTQTPPDFNAAIEVIDSAMVRYPNDARLFLERVTIENQASGREAALALVKGSLDRFPNSEQLRQLETLLSYDDPIEARLAMIDKSDMSEVQKHIARASLFLQNGRPQDGEAELAKANAISPNNPLVIELEFARALEKQDYAAGQRIAQRAAEINADGVSGQLYQARLELAEAKYDMAAATLDRVTREDEFNVAAWRFLGSAQLGAGRVEDAIRSFDRALKIKPDDVPTTLAYIGALSSVGRNADALMLARKASEMNGSESSIAGARLELEERYGDARYAIQQRLRIRTGSPGDRGNNLALAQLYMREGRLDEAQALLNATRVEGGQPDLSFAVAEARLLAAQGKVDEAVARVQREVAAMPADRQGEGYVVLADFLFQRQRPDEAVAALERARGSQGPLMAVDRKLGDYAFSVGDFERAIVAYRSVVDAGADREAIVAKRLAEAHLRIGQFDSAEAVITAVEAAQEEDSQTLLLRAQIALDRQNPLEARRLLDRAIEVDPRNPIAFLRRAQLGFTDDSQFAAVLRDLRQASQLQPDNITVRQMLSQLFIRRGRVNEAIDELAQAVRARPDNDSLRFEYVRLLGEYGTPDQMLAAIQQAVAERGADAPEWYTLAGNSLASAGDTGRATQLYERAYTAAPTTQTLAQLVQAYLASRPARTQDAMAAISGFSAVTPEQQFVIALLRARVEATAGNARAALQLLAQTWQLSGDSSAKTQLWFEQARAAFGANTADYFAFLDQLPPQTSAGMTPTAKVIMATYKAADPSRSSAILDSLAGLEDQTDDAGTLLALARVRGQLEYVTGDFNAAAAAYRLGLTVAPSDPELNNNLAYTLAKHLNQPQSALPYATRAAELAPLNANVLDTLGLIYLELKRYTQADSTFQRALDGARTDLERVPVLAHLAQAKKQLGDQPAAMNFARQAVQLGAVTQGAAQLYSTELSEAQAILDGR
jgi:tetratricopeptide (TPR) repeat protein